MRVVLAGGGTAGHVEPALNLADALMSRHPETKITMLGTAQGLETKLVPERGYSLELIPAVPMPRRPSKELLAVPGRLRAAIRDVRRILEATDAQVVVGFGGYVAMPAYLGARGRIPFVIHEANARPGLANRVGAQFTPYVAQAVDTSLRHGVTLGIPLRPTIEHLDRAMSRSQARDYFGLDPRLPCLFVFGGSLGARRINDALTTAVPGLIEDGVQILHAAGLKNTDQSEQLSQWVGRGYHPLPYVDRMDLAYAAADLAMCRAGAMTCAELTAVGLPAIYVPLPVGNGEQRLNALPTVTAGGGEFLADEKLSGPAIRQAVERLLSDPQVLAKMASNAERLGVRDAGARLAEMVERAIHDGRAQR